MKKRNDKGIIRVVVATGVSSVVTQILTIRECLSQFNGNEFVIALILFHWLVMGGVGTLAATKIQRRLPAGITTLGLLSSGLAALAGLQLLAIRLLRDVLFTPGVSVGFYPTLFYIGALLAPYTLLLGFLLPYSLFVIRETVPDYPGGRIYIADNFGDAAGGALFSFALVYWLSPLQAAGIAALVLVGAVVAMAAGRRPAARRVLVGAGLASVVIGGSLAAEPWTLRSGPGELVQYTESRYGRIAVYRDQEQITLFSNGTPLFSNQNQIVAEESVHYPLAQQTRTERILLISLEGGMLREIAKYRPGRVDLVELDPEIARTVFRWGLVGEMPGLNIFHQDGRAFLAGSTDRYDAIIATLPEPSTFQVNRFFTDRFFDMVRTHLQPGGVFGFAMEGYDNYLAEHQRRKLSSVYRTLKSGFRNILLIPGQQVYFICSDAELTSDIPARLQARGISTEYISRYYHGDVTPFRIDYLRKQIDPSAPANSDQAPVLMTIMFSQWFEKFATSPGWFFGIVGVLCLAYCLRLAYEEWVLFSTGATIMGIELLVIFAFQIFYGYVYHQIGLIVTIFLAGLLPGAWLGDELKRRGRAVLIVSDTGLLVLIGLLMGVVVGAGGSLTRISLLAIGLAASLACGCQFPVALHLRGGGSPAAARSFSADLMGAAAGTLLVSVVLIPYAGLVWTGTALVGIKMVSLVMVLLATPQPTVDK